MCSRKSLYMFYYQCSDIDALILSSCLPPTATGFPAQVQELLDQQQNVSAGSASLLLGEPELWLYIHTEPCCLSSAAVWPGGKHLLFGFAAAGSGRFSQAIWSSPGRFFPAFVPWSLMITLFFSPPALLSCYQVWQNTSDNLDLSVLNHFAEILKSPR